MQIKASRYNDYKPYPADLANKAATVLEEFIDAVNSETDPSEGYWIEQDNNSALFTLQALRDFEQDWCMNDEQYRSEHELD